MTANSASEKVKRLRAGAKRQETMQVLREGISLAFAIGGTLTVISGAVLLLPAVPTYLIGLVSTTILAFFLTSWRRSVYSHVYDNAAFALTHTELPRLILDEEVRVNVLSILNSPAHSIAGLIRIPAPRNLEEELRFSARYWLYFAADLKIKHPKSSLLNLFEPDVEEDRAMPRLRAICDFFLEQQAGVSL